MERPPPGTYRGLRCRSCEAVGTVVVHADGVGATEYITHRPGCPFAPQQPEHLRRRRAQIRRQERDLAAATGTRQTPASGALGGNDSRLVGGFRVEAKSTERAAWVVTPSFWGNLCAVSLRHDEEPLLVVDFLQAGRISRWVVMRLDAWLADGGPPPAEIEMLPRLNYHLKPTPHLARSVPGLAPPALVLPFATWTQKYQESAR